MSAAVGIVIAVTSSNTKKNFLDTVVLNTNKRKLKFGINMAKI